jgi:peptidoglycan hydrolase CwlO-like protein
MLDLYAIKNNQIYKFLFFNNLLNKISLDFFSEIVIIFIYEWERKQNNNLGVYCVKSFRKGNDKTNINEKGGNMQSKVEKQLELLDEISSKLKELKYKYEKMLDLQYEITQLKFEIAELTAKYERLKKEEK